MRRHPALGGGGPTDGGGGHEISPGSALGPDGAGSTHPYLGAASGLKTGGRGCVNSAGGYRSGTGAIRAGRLSPPPGAGSPSGGVARCAVRELRARRSQTRLSWPSSRSTGSRSPPWEPFNCYSRSGLGHPGVNARLPVMSPCTRPDESAVRVGGHISWVVLLRQLRPRERGGGQASSRSPTR